MSARDRARNRNHRVRAYAHTLFDEIWQSGLMDRTAAYEWLAYELSMPVSKCHLSKFDRQKCMRVVNICKRLLGKDVTHVCGDNAA